MQEGCSFRQLAGRASHGENPESRGDFWPGKSLERRNAPGAAAFLPWHTLCCTGPSAGTMRESFSRIHPASLAIRSSGASASPRLPAEVIAPRNHTKARRPRPGPGTANPVRNVAILHEFRGHLAGRSSPRTVPQNERIPRPATPAGDSRSIHTSLLSGGASESGEARRAASASQ